MYFVYVLKNDSGECYSGYTNNLERRVVEHNKERNWKLIYSTSPNTPQLAAGMKAKVEPYEAQSFDYAQD